MTLKEAYQAEVKRAKQALKDMKKLKADNQKALREARNEVSHYSRQIKEYNYTLRSLKDSVRQHRRLLRDMNK